jgi:hypothetical protein
MKSLQAFLSVSFLLQTARSVDLDDFTNIVQLSKENQNVDLDVQRLRASIIPCLNQHHKNRGDCKPSILIRAWMNQKSEKQTFLLIDEVHDARERTNRQLINPYLIQVSTGEPTSMYPLVLNQVVDVTCPTTVPVQRRTVDNGATLADEGENPSPLFFDSFNWKLFFAAESGDKRSQKDSLEVIRTQSDAAIKSNFPDFVVSSGTEVRSRVKGDDLLQHYFVSEKTAKSPSGSRENNHHQHDITESHKPELGNGMHNELLQIADDHDRPQKFHEKSTHREPAESPALNVIMPILPDSFQHSNEGFKFEAPPKDFGQKSTELNFTANPYRISDAVNLFHRNHQHQLTPSHNHHLPSRNENRFYVNLNGNEAAGENLDDRTVIEANAMPAGVINDVDSHKSKDFNQMNRQQGKFDQHHAIGSLPQTFDVHLILDRDQGDDRKSMASKHRTGETSFVFPSVGQSENAISHFPIKTISNF